MIHRINLLLLLLLCLAAACHKPLYVQQRTQALYELKEPQARDSALLLMLAPYKAGVDTQMRVVIGHTDLPLTKAQPESLLGNFAADAQLQAARRLDPKVVGSVVNFGGLRIAYLSPGPITRGAMYELMPFDNTLCIVEVPGPVLRTFCNHMARYRGWPVSGMRFVIQDDEARDITINGAPLNDHLVYKIVVSDYMARGGDHCDFLTPLRRRFTSVLLRDALIDYVKSLDGSPLHPELQNRISYAQ